MVVQLQILSELRELLPEHTKEEREQLEANLLADGIRDPIVYWQNGKRAVVVDGMTRLEIARKHDLSYDTKAEDFEDIEAAKLWILENQLGRRNVMNSAQLRQIRGELYNRLKTPRESRKHSPKGHFEPLVDAAAVVAEKSGASRATVKRDGARVEALSECDESIRKGVNSGAIKLSDAEVKQISKLPPEDQTAVASELRMGRASNVKAAMKSAGVKAPKSKPKQPPKKLDRSAYYRQWDNAIGPLVRLVDTIAAGVEESKSAHHNAVQILLNDATKRMMTWMGVKK